MDGLGELIFTIIFGLIVATIGYAMMIFLSAAINYDPNWKAIEAEKQGQAAIIAAESQAAHQQAVDAAFTARSEAETQIYMATENLRLAEVAAIQPTRIMVQQVLLWMIPAVLLVVILILVGGMVLALRRRLLHSNAPELQTRYLPQPTIPTDKVIELTIPERIPGVSRRKQLAELRRNQPALPEH